MRFQLKLGHHLPGSTGAPMAVVPIMLPILFMLSSSYSPISSVQQLRLNGLGCWPTKGASSSRQAHQDDQHDGVIPILTQHCPYLDPAHAKTALSIGIK